MIIRPTYAMRRAAEDRAIRARGRGFLVEKCEKAIPQLQPDDAAALRAAIDSGESASIHAVLDGLSIRGCPAVADGVTL